MTFGVTSISHFFEHSAHCTKSACDALLHSTVHPACFRTLRLGASAGRPQLAQYVRTFTLTLRHLSSAGAKARAPSSSPENLERPAVALQLFPAGP